MFYTIYMTENLINGKRYIGKHQTQNINDNYLGSGILITKAIKKYGRENFNKTILHAFETEEEMNAVEKLLITEDIIKSEDYYNISLGGNGGCIVLKKDHPLYEETLDKIRTAVRSDKNREKLRKIVTELHKTKQVGMYGKKQSEHQKKTISKLMKGRIKTPEETEKRIKSYRKTVDNPNYVHPIKGRKFSKEHCENIRKARRDTSGENNPNYGNTHSNETRAKISAKAKERNRNKIECIHCGKKCSLLNHNRWHGDNCKLKI